RKRVAQRFVKEEYAELARLVSRIRHHRPTIIRDRDAGPAETVHNLEINRHAGSHLKLIANPKSSAGSVGTSLPYALINLPLQVRAFNRREVPRLRECAGDHTEHQRNIQNDPL